MLHILIVMKNTVGKMNIEDFADKTLLIVDDDDPFRNRLGRAMGQRVLKFLWPKSVEEGLISARKSPPGFAVVDLRLLDGNGLDVIEEIHKLKPDSRVVMLTGYGNLPTAVSAVKAGAIDYLAKPADAEDVEAALLANRQTVKLQPPENPMSADKIKMGAYSTRVRTL